MASEITSLHKPPVIQFSKLDNLNPGSPEWQTVKSQVLKALEDFGCFEALVDQIPVECQKGTFFGAIQELFDLPSESKMRNVSDKLFHGYHAQLPHLPLYESLGIEDANMAEKVESMTNVFWPEGNPSFSKTILSFSQQASKLDRLVRKMIVESLGLEKYMDEHIKSTYYLFKAMKYEGPETIDDTKPALPSHTDNGTLTVLYQDQIGGLQFQTKDGEWMSVVPSPQSFIVSVGDSLCAWTNGRLHPPHHRVMKTGNKTRYSVALFAIPKPGSIIKVPEEIIDEERPLLFKPFNISEFAKFCFSEAGQKATSQLKVYCGV